MVQPFMSNFHYKIVISNVKLIAAEKAAYLNPLEDPELVGGLEHMGCYISVCEPC